MSLETSVMDALPDELLLEVLQYLDVRDLLGCRMVCRRLQALVGDGRVWRDREVRLDVRCYHQGYHGLEVFAPERGPVHLLSLAPCLGHLRVCATAGTLRALTTTQCAVASLTLVANHLGFNSPFYAMQQVVKRQEALGRLRSLHLICYDGSDNASGVFLDALATCSRLESLICNSGSFRLSPASTALFASPVRPSLRNFSWPLLDETAPFVRAVLAGHSATLEDVELRVSLYDDDTVAPILGALPKLHSLRLAFSLPGVLEVPARVELLRRAKQLRDVCLGLYMLSAPECEVLLEALASPGLERLELDLPDTFIEARSLLRALPALPALRHLVLGQSHYSLPTAMIRDLLRGITAPALHILELKMLRWDCPHTWVHEDAVRTALISNPSLHIQLDFQAARGCPKGPDCEECAMGCHKDIWKAGGRPSDILKVSIHLEKLHISVSSRVLLS